MIKTQTSIHPRGFSTCADRAVDASGLALLEQEWATAIAVRQVYCVEKTSEIDTEKIMTEIESALPFS